MKHVFVYGPGQRKGSWNEVIKGLGLESFLEVQTFAPESKKSYPAAYDSLKSFCRQEEGKLRLYGLSLAGTLAVNYAIDFPDRLDSLVIVGSQFSMSKMAMSAQSLVYKLLPPEVFEALGLGKDEAVELMRSMRGLDLRKDFGKISCPVLAVCGQKDTANQASMEKFARRLPDARYVKIPDVGHQVNLLAGQELAREILSFLGDS